MPPKGKSDPEQAVLESAVYQQMLDDLASEGGESNIAFVRDGRNRYRLIRPDSTSSEFFREVFREFRASGQPPQRRKRYCLKVWTLDDQAVKGLVIAKTALRQILNLLVEGYELFDPILGHGITIVRSGKGLETSYSVVASPKAVPLPQEATDDTTSLSDYAAMVEKMNQRGAQDKAAMEGEELPFSNGRDEGGQW